MHLSAQQQTARLNKASQIAEQAGADFLIMSAPENIYYFSGFRTTIYTRFSGVIVSAARNASAVPPVLVIPGLEYSLATDDWWSPSWYPRESIMTYGPSKEHKDHLSLLSSLIPAGSTVGVDSLTYAGFMALSAQIPGLKAVPVYDAANAAKQIKTQAEIDALTRANQIALQGFHRAVSYITAARSSGKPVTEIDIAVEMDNEARRLGSDGFGYATLVSWGDKLMAPHSPPLCRAVPEDELVRIAFGPAYQGYSADLVRTLVLGKPPELLLKLRDAYRLGRKACFENAKPGVTVSDMLDAVSGAYRCAGMLEAWDYNAGHGIGITIHEPPRIALGNQGVLQENMVLAIEPVLEVGPVGYNHCDVIKVTCNGGVNLAPGLDDVIVIQ